MNRRSVILGAIGTATSCTAFAAGGQIPGPMGQTVNRVYVQTPIVIKQACSEWCWAASISMIFAMNGYQVSQADIVATIFNGLPCTSAQTIMMTTAVSIPWRDDSGRTFRANLLAGYDVGQGVIGLDYRIPITELFNNRPVLYANSHHAMVLSQMDYVATPGGPRVLQMGVFDPWPGSPNFHPLTQAEMVGAELGGDMHYLAAVAITNH